MTKIEQIKHILTYRERADLAQILHGSRYELNESSTFGSRWNSLLTGVELYAPFDKHEQLQKLDDDDRVQIIDAFKVIYPVKENGMEINYIEFFVDPDSINSTALRSISSLDKIDFPYITEQIKKCDDKIAQRDLEGAITNARNLIESICKYILDETNTPYSEDSDLPSLYKEASKCLNMHPSTHVENSFKQILSGGVNIIQGFSAIRNKLSDAHGKSQVKSYKPDMHHAIFVVGIAKSLADFIFASYSKNKE